MVTNDNMAYLWATNWLRLTHHQRQWTATYTLSNDQTFTWTVIGRRFWCSLCCRRPFSYFDLSFGCRCSGSLWSLNWFQWWNLEFGQNFHYYEFEVSIKNCLELLVYSDVHSIKILRNTVNNLIKGPWTKRIFPRNLKMVLIIPLVNDSKEIFLKK